MISPVMVNPKAPATILEIIIFDTISPHSILPSAYCRPHSKQASRPPTTTPTIPPLTMPFMVWMMAKRMASMSRRPLASAMSVGLIRRAPSILLHGEHHHIPFSAIVAPPHALGMIWDQSFPLWNFDRASGPPARIGAGMVSQIAFAKGILLYSPPAYWYFSLNCCGNLSKSRLRAKKLRKLPATHNPPKPDAIQFWTSRSFRRSVPCRIESGEVPCACTGLAGGDKAPAKVSVTPIRVVDRRNWRRLRV